MPWNDDADVSCHLSLHRVPKDVGSMNKISPSVPILSIPISLEEGAASNDIIFPSLLGLPRCELQVQIYVLNRAKSILVPLQNCVFLGAMLLPPGRAVMHSRLKTTGGMEV